jgi:signal transduction histidine kinase
MSSRRSVHTLFAVALVALFALGISWTAFIWRANRIERELSLERLASAVHTAATACGLAVEPTPLGPLPGGTLEIVPAASASALPAQLVAPCAPLHTSRVVRPTASALEAIDDKLTLRRIQFHGESTTLLLLLAACTAMLYRLVRGERRSTARMKEFLATVTHEMKTPLTGVKSLLQTMAAGRVPPEQCTQLVGLGLKETERLEHMIDNVLMSGRLRADALQTHVESLPLREFVEHRRRYMVGGEDRLQLRWQVGADNLVVRGDANAVRVILENLTDNAFKYGGDSVVELIVAHQEQYGQITVADCGIGFSHAGVAELFAPFRRAGEAHNGQHGTGLGLSLSLALARQMGGELSAASDGPGQGARFTLTLPVVTS